MSAKSERFATSRLGSLLALAKSQRGMLRFIILIVMASAVLTALLLACMRPPEGAAVNLHFTAALGLGAFFTLLLGFGLMSLVFYSARRGFDEPVEVEVGDSRQT